MDLDQSILWTPASLASWVSHHLLLLMYHWALTILHLSSQVLHIEFYSHYHTLSLKLSYMVVGCCCFSGNQCHFSCQPLLVMGQCCMLCHVDLKLHAALKGLLQFSFGFCDHSWYFGGLCYHSLVPHWSVTNSSQQLPSSNVSCFGGPFQVLPRQVLSVETFEDLHIGGWFEIT